MKLYQKIAWGLLGSFVFIQFIRPSRNLGVAATPTSLDKSVAIPDTVNALLQRSCYDCHSNHTDYVWYDAIQPAAWFVNDHIEEGKDELNFSDWTTYSKKKQVHKLQELVEMVREVEMPLSSYTLLHRDAELNADERKILTDWAENLMLETP